MVPHIRGLLVERQFSHVLPSGAVTPIAHESRGAAIIIGNATCQIVGTLFFLARVYSRGVIINSWKAEDTTLAVAWLFATGFSICQYAQVYLGYGHHLTYIFRHLGAYHSSVSQQYAFASQILVLFALAAPKLSICLTYLRLVSSDTWGRRLIKLLIVVVVAPTIPFIFGSIFQCRPISAYWTEGRPASKCAEDISGLWISGGMSIFVDLALVVIVLPQVLRLHLNTRQRWSLISIVMLGLLAAGAGLTRIVRVNTTLRKQDFDPSWDMYDLSIWTATEIYVSLICAAAPGMKPLVSKILPKLLGSTLASDKHTATTGYKSTHPPDSVELSLSRQRRGTIGSTRVRRNTHDSILEEGDGPYTEVGRGVDGRDDDEVSVESKWSATVVAERLPRIEEVEATRDVP
ncbi:unnamed protein product [Periconia digitata]|uniref:Rhodopsin domain-containing protein n=1 Tax=Periconia digitata TaxID=1303443 RepID=A0A9W4UVI5_9PLEO|nr:unnamed protein product [Periconia digitata]